MKTIAGIAILFVLFVCAGTALANQIHPVSGAYYTSVIDLKVAAQGVPMVWERRYRSNRTVMRIEGPEIYSYEYAAPSSGPLGFGWYSPFFMRIQKNAAIVSDPIYNTDALVDADGRYIYFPKGAADTANGYILNSTTTGYTLTQRGGNTWTFDTTGRLLTITDPQGRMANLVYSGDVLTSIADASGRTVYTLSWESGRVTKVTDLAGRSILYEYDGASNLSLVKHDGETIFSYGYNASHGLTSNSNALGETWTVTYRFPQNQGIAASLTQPGGGSTTQQYDKGMTSVTITNPAGVTRTQTRNDDGQLSSEQDSTGGKTTSIAYLGGGVRVLTDADGNSTKEYRDQWDNVTKRIDAEGGVSLFSYNDKGKPTSITDAEGATTVISYDNSGVKPAQVTRAYGTADQTVTTYSYSSSGDLQSTDIDGATTSFTYNAAGLPLTITDPDGGVTKLSYDLVGNLTSMTDGNDNKTEYTYDWRGNLLTTKNGEGGVTTNRYNQAGRLQNVTDALGRVSSVTSDYRGKVTSVTDPAGTATFEYDGAGNLKSVTRGDAITTYTYDSMNRVTSVTDPESNKTRYSYSKGGGTCSTCGSGSNGNIIPTVVTNPLGGVTTSTLDKLGRIKVISDPLNNAINFEYDKVGKMTSKRDANGFTTSYLYDALGRLRSQTDAGGGITSFTYDKRGNLVSLTDPENNTSNFEYDKAGRRVRETRPEGQATVYTYYPNGLLKTMKDAKGQVTTYLYDKANRLVEMDIADSTKQTFGYDAVGNMTSYSSPAASGTLIYDAANRMTSETVNFGPFSKRYSYSYDGRGNKASFTSPEGTTYNYSYNKNDQPVGITTPVGAIAIAYQWNRQAKLTLPNGTVTDFTYNSANWLSRIEAKSTAIPSVGLTNSTYTFDKTGNVTGKTAEAGTFSYGYDALYRVTAATVPSLPQEVYTYDKVGNRKTSANTAETWSYNKNNELLSYNGTSFSYDANGNITTKIEYGATTTYSYGATNRLTGVQLPDGRAVTSAYDPFARRVKKQVGAETTFFLYGDEGLIGEYDATGKLKKGYGWQPGAKWGTNPLLATDGINTYFYHNDHLGTPQRVTDAAGKVVWSAISSAFGETTVETGSTFVNNLRLPGQYFDEETQLHYNWFRNYDPAVGRYTSKDPIGFAGLQANLFGYVFQNPVNVTDPNGLRTWTINRHGTSASILIFGFSGQVVDFVSNCENNTRIKRTYIVLGAGIGVGLGIKSLKVLGEAVEHAYNQSGNDHMGGTQIDDLKIPAFGLSVSGPTAALIYGGGLGSANIAFDKHGENAYSEVYAATDGPGLGISIFNFEGQLYFHWGDEATICQCEKVTEFDKNAFLKGL